MQVENYIPLILTIIILVSAVLAVFNLNWLRTLIIKKHQIKAEINILDKQLEYVNSDIEKMKADFTKKMKVTKKE